MDYLAVLFGVVGGLALFLYGMLLLSGGLKKIAGNKLKQILEKITDNPLKGVVVGAGVTALVQSSSITTVTLVGLLNAGLITLEQAIGVIMGANIGTTITAQVIAFNIGSFALPIIAIGFIIYFLKKGTSEGYAGEIILGFGLLFLGMVTMSTYLKPLSSETFFIELLASFGQNPLLGIIAGAVFTAIVQSSSATTGLVIAMASEGILDLPSAIALILGANIGTCITILIASIGSGISSKRAALGHIIINVFGVLIFLPFIPLFSSFVAGTASDLPRQIANAHTIFNVIVVLLLLPLFGVIILVLKKLVPGQEIKVERGTKYIDDKLLSLPSVAIEQAEKEVERMGKLAIETIKLSEIAFFKNDSKSVALVHRKEDVIDEIDNLIENYLVKISENDLSKEQAKRVAALIHAISDIERVSDHANNIAELAGKKIKEDLIFSKPAINELKKYFLKTKIAFIKSIKVLKTDNHQIAEEVLVIEKETDALLEEFEDNHFKRLEKGECDSISGVVYVEILRNLERVADHSRNISKIVLLGF